MVANDFVNFNKCDFLFDRTLSEKESLTVPKKIAIGDIPVIKIVVITPL